jgi:hypothetical protein
MARSKANRANHALVALAVCAAAAGLGLALRSNRIPAVASTFTPTSQPPDMKVIVKESRPNEPVQFGDLRVQNVEIPPGKPFSASELAHVSKGQPEDWLGGLHYSLKNTTDKRMTFILAELQFPETTTTGPLMVYNRLGIGIPPFKPMPPEYEGNKSLSLDPGDTVTFQLSPAQLEGIKSFIGLRNFQLADLSKVTVKITYVIFDDGTKWDVGHYYKPNPSAPHGWERID